MNNRQSKSGSKKQNAHKTQSKMIKSNHQISLSDMHDHSKCGGDWQCRRQPVLDNPQDIIPLDNQQDKIVLDNQDDVPPLCDMDGQLMPVLAPELLPLIPDAEPTTHRQ